ncbi:MAG: lipopolysaccharide kinase InaA family protein [Candidatus Bathyarchaeia archaeon]
MVQSSKRQDEKLTEDILSFSRHIAGSSRIAAACLCSNYSSLSTSRTAVQVLLVIEDFQPRLMNYVKALGVSSLVVLAVDKWVFERDVDRGLLGEALAGGLIFPYKPMVNGAYLYLQEIMLKRRLILELLQSLVLDFPELSYEFYIKPEYFMFETWLTRAKLFPPMLDSLPTLVKEEKGLQQTLGGFLDALKKLEEEGPIRLSEGYVKISKEFVDQARTRKVRFTNLLKTGHRALFASLLGMLPQMLNVLSQNTESLFSFQRLLKEGARAGMPIDDPKNLVYVKTASGLVPLANRMGIGAFARKVLRADESAKIKVTNIGGILNDVYLVSANIDGKEKRVVVKRFRDWSNFKWFPLTLWSVGTRTFAVLGRSRLERECAINRLLHSEGFAVPELLYVSPNERLIFTEYVVGEDLSNAVKRIAISKNDSELKKDFELMAKVGNLFAKVHALGVSLGDTKPENILVDRKGELYLTDLEQAGRNGDRAWDVAEFLYYSGHYISPFAVASRVELMAKAFIAGYLQAGGNIKAVKNAGNTKYTKVFSVFTFPHVMLILSNACRKAEQVKA